MPQPNEGSGVRGPRILSILVGLTSVVIADIALFKSINCKYKYKMYRIQLGIFIEILLFFMSKFIWRRLDCLVHQESVLKSIWRCTVIMFLIISQLGPVFNYYNAKEPSIIVSIAWCFCAVELILFAIIRCFDLFYVILNLLRQRESSLAKFCQSNTCTWISLIFTIAYIIYGYSNATSLPIVLKHTIPMAKLPKSMDGFTIGLMSDIHLGSTVGFTMMENAVKITNSLDPDIVVIAGDLTDGTLEELKEAALPLRDLSSQYGSFFVTGNHEYYTSDVENWMEFLESIGIHVLHNSNKKIHSRVNNKDWFCIFGTDDRQSEVIGYDGHSVNLTKAFSGCDDKHAAILIAHQPNIAKRALVMGLPVQLVLSGHTHAGQIFPFSIPVYLANAFYAGLYQYDDDSYVYVSQGTYFYGYPLRTASHNEITKITLKSS